MNRNWEAQAHRSLGDIFAEHVYGNNLQSDNRENYEFASAYKDVGLELEKKEKDTKMDSKAPNYYYPIIEKLEKWIIIKRSKIGTM